MSATPFTEVFEQGLETMTDTPPPQTKCEAGCGRLATKAVVINGQVWDLCAIHNPKEADR